MPDPISAFLGEKQLKTTALAAVIRAYTGSNPIIEKHDTHTDIKFTPEQVKVLQATLESWHNQEPGTVRVNSGPIFLPYYLRRYWYYIAGVAAVGALAGFMMGGRK